MSWSVQTNGSSAEFVVTLVDQKNYRTGCACMRSGSDRDARGSLRVPGEMKVFIPLNFSNHRSGSENNSLRKGILVKPIFSFGDSNGVIYLPI